MIGWEGVATTHLDRTVFLLGVQGLELTLLLPVVQAAHQDDDEDRDDDRNALHPIDLKHHQKGSDTCYTV